MNSKFMITGLPRSRTAWWSVMASTPVSVCTHEPVKISTCFADLLSFWADPNHQFAGISDSSLYMQLDRILNQVQPQMLVILRDPGQVMESLRRCFARPKSGATLLDEDTLFKRISEAHHRLTRVANHALVKTVQFDDLNHEGVVASCLEWILPGQGHHMKRDLLNMNIQVEMSSIKPPANEWYLQ